LPWSGTCPSHFEFAALIAAIECVGVAVVTVLTSDEQAISTLRSTSAARCGAIVAGLHLTVRIATITGEFVPVVAALERFVTYTVATCRLRTSVEPAVALRVAVPVVAAVVLGSAVRPPEVGIFLVAAFVCCAATGSQRQE
jgi:hypothetical protein